MRRMRARKRKKNTNLLLAGKDLGEGRDHELSISCEVRKGGVGERSDVRILRSKSKTQLPMYQEKDRWRRALRRKEISQGRNNVQNGTP